MKTAVKVSGKNHKFEILLTTKETNALLGTDWMKHFEITLDAGKTSVKSRSIQKDTDATTLKRQFKNVSAKKRNRRNRGQTPTQRRTEV